MYPSAIIHSVGPRPSDNAITPMRPCSPTGSRSKTTPRSRALTEHSLAAPVVSMIASGKPKAKPPNQTAATSMPAASKARGPSAPGTRK